MFKIHGKVIEKETGKGIPNLIVKAIDKDLFFDDLLGAVRTDENGDFEIRYDREDFQELFFDKEPDIYLKIKALTGEVLLTTEDKVRYESGETEEFVIGVPEDLVKKAKEGKTMMMYGDNPYDDGLDHVGCPPKPAQLTLPDFPNVMKGNCKLICWGRCMTVPDGERRMVVLIDDFVPAPNECGVYEGTVAFIDAITGDVWYKGRIRFYYTRNYIYEDTNIYGEKQKSIAFRFVAKGDINRVYDKMPEWECLILCTKELDAVEHYDDIFVYGGLDILVDVDGSRQPRFMLNLGHNDGWYTHHPECSRRPINWVTHAGDYIGHYCERGWLFVSPGKNFVFNPGIVPPTGKFTEEALRAVGGMECHTEEAIEWGALGLNNHICIHWYQNLRGETECGTSFHGDNLCQGLVYTGEPTQTLTFFSMGYWQNQYQDSELSLHLAEGNIKVQNRRINERVRKYYVYGFATQDRRREFKLVDLASNKNDIGIPADTELLMYLYNAGPARFNPKVLTEVAIDPRLLARVKAKEMDVLKDMDRCPFLPKADEEQS